MKILGASMVGNMSMVTVPLEEKEAQYIWGKSYDCWEIFVQ
jgi:hypothetical protein